MAVAIAGLGLDYTLDCIVRVQVPKGLDIGRSSSGRILRPDRVVVLVAQRCSCEDEQDVDPDQMIDSPGHCLE
jgi:hypothetical protein